MSILFTDNPIALGALLNEVIFDIQQDVVSEAPVAETTFSFLGGNKKHIVFVLKNDVDDFFSEPAEAAFLKTLQALSLQLEDVAVFNISKLGDITLNTIKETFTPSYVILLTDHENLLPNIPLEKNVPSHIEQIFILMTHSFEQMLREPQLKKLFWPALKNLLSTHG